MTNIYFYEKIFALFLIGVINIPTLAEAKSGSETTGDILQILIPASAYSATFILDDEKGRNQFYKSFITNVSITYALKYTINKDRPDNNGGKAFPSGHTSAAFQGAEFLRKRYGMKYGLPAYIAATYVGWSRVDNNQHDVADVIAGAAIGVLSSYYFTKKYKGFVVQPTVKGDAYGLTISRQW